MNILAIDTSGTVAGVAVLRDGKVAYEALAQNRLTHSENLMPMVDEALRRSELTIQEIHLIAPVVGPGSFTGVRLGVALTKGMCRALSINAVPVNALEALAQNGTFFEGLIIPMQDARAEQVYCAAFEGRTMRRLWNDRPLAVEEVCRQAIESAKPVLCLGDGAVRYEEMLRKNLNDQIFLSPTLNSLRPSAAGLMALTRTDTAVSYSELCPLYLRKPQAERRRELQNIRE